MTKQYGQIFKKLQRKLRKILYLLCTVHSLLKLETLSSLRKGYTNLRCQVAQAKYIFYGDAS